MDFLEVVRRRRMVRRFTDEPVPWETVERIVRVAQHAPSAGFSQGVSYVAIDDVETRRQVAAIVGEEGYVAAGFGPFVSDAPVQIVICTSEETYQARYREPDKHFAAAREVMWPIPYWHTDAGAALMLVLLAVVNEGLASAFVGIRDPAAVRAVLQIPDDHLPIGVVALGHPATDKRSRSLKRGRKALDTVLHRNRWSHPRGRVYGVLIQYVLPVGSVAACQVSRPARANRRKAQCSPIRAGIPGDGSKKLLFRT